jgi:hypothetical protein
VMGRGTRMRINRVIRITAWEGLNFFFIRISTAIINHENGSPK